MGRDSRGGYDDDQRGSDPRERGYGHPSGGSGERSVPPPSRGDPSGPGMRRGSPSDPTGRRSGSGGVSRPPTSGAGATYGQQSGGMRRASRPGDTPSRGPRSNGGASGAPRPQDYPPDRYDSGRSSAQRGSYRPDRDEQPDDRGGRRSMRDRAAGFARGMSEQLSAVVESARGALRGRGEETGDMPSAAMGATFGAMSSDERAALDARAYRRSRIRMLARKWRQGRHSPHAVWYAAGFAITGLLLVALMGASVGGGFYALSYYNSKAVAVNQVAQQAEIGSTTIYDRNGKVLYVAPKANGVNIYLPYNQLSDMVKKATVSTEDRTFFDSTNIGIDWTSIVRSALTDVASGSAAQGGSTITQQLVKRLVLDNNQKALTRKINEAILSVGITESGTYSKTKILEMYLDTIDYSDGNLGIEAAAQNYFGLSPIKATAPMKCAGQTIPAGQTCWANQQLDWAQVAMLVGVPNAPSIYRPNVFTYDCGANGKASTTPCSRDKWDNPCAGDPLTSNVCYPDASGAGYFDYQNLGHEWLVYHRAKTVLDSLLRDGWMSPNTHDKSLAEVLSILENHKIYSHAGNTTFSSSGATKNAPHFVDYVMSELHNEYGIQDVASAGIKVYTTLDLDLDTYAIQDAQYYITKTHNMAWPTYCSRSKWGCVNVPPLAQTDNVHNAAVMVIDPYTGDILAMVGSVDYTSRDPKVDGFFNTATSPSRSLGSSTKPIFYATAFQMGLNPGTMLQDSPVCFPIPSTDPKPTPDFATPGCGGNWYTPHNFDNHSFSGNIPMRFALANSLNIPATEMMSFVGDSPDYSANALTMAARMGITSLKQNLMGPTTALGTQSISLLQLTSAYGVFPTGGKHVAPRSILEIVFPDGRPPYHAPQPQLAQVISPQAAYMITSILNDKAARIADFNYSNPLEFDDTDPSTPTDDLNYSAVAAKTGTSQGTNGAKDIVTMGYSPYAALGVWAGNADSTDLGNVIGISGAGYIFHDVMAWMIVHYKWPKGQRFQIPSGMSRGTFNCATGLAPYKDQPTPPTCAFAPTPGFSNSTNFWAGYGGAQPDTDWYIQGLQWLQS